MLKINYEETVLYKKRYTLEYDISFNAYEEFIEKILKPNINDIYISEEKVISNQSKDCLLIECEYFKYKENEDNILLIVEHKTYDNLTFLKDKKTNDVYIIVVENDIKSECSLTKITKNKELEIVIESPNNKVSLSLLKIDPILTDYISYTEDCINLDFENININKILLNPKLITKKIDCFLHGVQYESVVYNDKKLTLDNFKIRESVISVLKSTMTRENYLKVKEIANDLNNSENRLKINEMLKSYIEAELLVNDTAPFKMISDSELMTQINLILDNKLMIKDKELFNMKFKDIKEEIVEKNNFNKILNLSSIKELYALVIKEEKIDNSKKIKLK